MRAVTVIAAVLLGSLAGSQNPNASDPEYTPIRPQVVAYVRQHVSGANLVQLSMVEPNYPADLLQRQITTMCEKLEYPARGLQIYQEELVANNPNLRFLKATFATGNLTAIDGTVNLTPMIQAFAGAPAPHTVKGMTIMLDEFQPTARTMQNFKSPAVVIHGRIDENPPTIEYQVQLLSQNPSEIVIRNEAPRVERPVSQAPARRPSPAVVWSLIVLAGVAAGALVYFVLIKREVRSPSDRSPRSLK